MDLPSHPSLSNTSFSSYLHDDDPRFLLGVTAFWLTGCWRAKEVKERVLALIVAAYLAQLCLYPANLSETARSMPFYPLL